MPGGAPVAITLTPAGPIATDSPLVIAIVCYYRVSTRDQGKRGYSLPEQRDQCMHKARELAQQAADEVGQSVELHIAEFTDAVGGEFRNRPGLQQALDFARHSRAQWWVCMDPDRFSRTLRIQLEVADEIEAAGAGLAFVYYQHEDSPEGWAFFQIRGVFSELDKKKILRRLKAGAQRKLKQERKLPWGVTMRGYTFDKETDTLLIDAADGLGNLIELSPAWWVLRWKTWCAEEDMSVEEIRQRYFTLTGEWVGRNTIRQTLVRDCYATGKYVVNRRDWTGYQAVKEFNRQVSPEQRQPFPQPTPKPESEHVAIDVPAFVPMEIQNTIERHLRRRTHKPRSGEQRMLQGLGLCGACGARLTYGPRGASGLMLTCVQRWAENRKLPLNHPSYVAPCKSSSKLASKVEDAIWDEVVAALLDPSEIEKAWRQERQRQQPADRLIEELAQITARLAAITAERQRYGLLFARQVWTMEDVEAATQPLAEQDRLLRQRQAELTTIVSTDRRGQPGLRVLNAAATLGPLGEQHLHAMPRSERRAYILDVIDSFSLHSTKRGAPPKLTIQWR